MPDIQTKRETNRDLSDELVTLDESAINLATRLLAKLEIVIEEANRAHPQHDDHTDPDVAIGQSRPKQRRNDGRGDYYQPTHGGRVCLSGVALWSPCADDLIYSVASERSNYHRPHQEGEEQRRDRGARGAEADVAEQSEKSEMSS